MRFILILIYVFYLVSGIVMNGFGQEYYYGAENMLDVNIATFDELMLLPGINRYQAYKIIEYRRVFGYFLALDELLKVEGLSLQDVASWQSYITVTPPDTRGAPKGSLKLKTIKISNIEGGEYQILHLRWKNFQPGWSAVVLLEQYPHYAGYRVEGSKAGNGYWSQGYLLNKYYLVWEPNSGIKKLLVGDYLVGFGEGVAIDLTGRSKPAGIYPGDLEAVEYNTAKISNHALLQGVSYKSSKSLRGIAMALEQGQFKETIFYSNQSNAYYGFYINDSTIRKPLEHYFSEQVSGMDITTYVLGDTEVGVTGFFSQREAKGPDPWRYPADDKNFFVFGSHINSYIGRLNLCGEIGKLDRYGEGIFTEGSVDFGRINYSLSYRKYDLDYYNPHAGSYSRHYPQSVFRCRDECGVLGKISWQIIDTAKATASFDQYTHHAQAYWSKKKGDYTVSISRKETDREIIAGTMIQGSPKLGMSIETRYKDNNIHQNTGSEKIGTATKLKYVFSSRGDASLKYYLCSYLHSSGDYTPYDYIALTGAYQLTIPCQIEGGGKYKNIIWYRKFDGIREYYGKIKYKFRKVISLQLGYVTTYILGDNSTYEFEDEADLIADEDAFFQETWTLDVVFNW